MEKKSTLMEHARRILFQQSMRERKTVRMRAARFSNRTTGKRETFKIAISVPEQGANNAPDASQRTLDNATKIFENLVESGRLPRKK